MKIPLSAVALNYDPETQSVVQPNIPFMNGNGNCNNCFAQVGADIEFYLFCSKDGCNMLFKAGGGASFNIDAKLTAPTFTIDVNNPHMDTLIPAQATPPLLFQAFGIEVYANPSLSVGYSGTLALAGEIDFHTSFKAEADMMLGYLKDPASGKHVFTEGKLLCIFYQSSKKNI